MNIVGGNQINPFINISSQFQEVHRLVKHIVHDMHSQIGTPEDVKIREQAEREKLLEIEEQLKSFKQSRFQPQSSPENSQVRGRSGRGCGYRV